MKKKVIGLLFILSLMLVIPMLFAINKDFSHIELKHYTEQETVVEMVCADYREEYTEETLKALTLIRYSNYKHGNNKENIKLISEKDFLKKYSKSHLEKIKNAVNSTYKKVITYKDKIAKIPYFYCGNGHINSNKKYPYIKDCACPWDAVNDERTDKTTGVSLNTINYLTKQGSNCKEALGRFLDNVEITEYSSKKRERVD